MYILKLLFDDLLQYRDQMLSIIKQKDIFRRSRENLR